MSLDAIIPPGSLRPTTLQANAWAARDVSGELGNADQWGLDGTDRPDEGDSTNLAPTEPAKDEDFEDPRNGWGLVLPDLPTGSTLDPRTADDAPEPIRALFESRKDFARVYRFTTDPTAAVVSLRDYVIGGDLSTSLSESGIAAPGEHKLAKYLLLYGGPDVLPWDLQYQLNAGHCVGRLHLTGDGLDNYVSALMGGWKDSAARYDAPVVWSVDHGGGDITSAMRTHLGAVVASKHADDDEMSAAVFLDGAAGPATGGALVDALAANTPSVVVTTSHGVTAPLDDGEQMAAQLGMLVDSDHTPVDPDALVGAWQPDGAVWYAHACCSAGADSQTNFAGLVAPDSVVDRVLRAVAAIGPRVSPLPTALLGASRPARAFVGHVEPTFNWTVVSPFTNQPLMASTVTALYDRLCLDAPVGLAMREVYEGIGPMAGTVNAAVRRFGQGDPQQTVNAAIWSKLVLRDLESVVILGDPTVTIPRP